MSAVACAAIAPAFADVNSDFIGSPAKSHALAWYWLNSSIANTEVDNQLTALRDNSQYAGIFPCFASDNWWSTSTFLSRYHHMMDKCDELGMTTGMNDDYWYPSGSAKGAISQYPDACARRIAKTEQDFAGPTTCQMSIPAGVLMGCVAMNNGDHGQLTDITANASGSQLSWSVPSGSWKIMIFTTSKWGDIVDYLSADAVRTWIGLTYQKFYDAMPDHFGTTIKSTFSDDVCYIVGAGGWNGQDMNFPVAWTNDFNTKFQVRYGFSPVKYYPAMWYDIGANTAAARNMLFGFRDDLFARNFGGTIGAWCAAHNIEASGHYGCTGWTDGWLATADPIKFFKYFQRSGTEGWRGMMASYKFPASAAFLYDKPLCVNQNYALVEDFTKNDLYQMAMESFVRGVNYQYCDGVFYNFSDAFYPPELSWRDPQNGPLMPEYNKWVGRCQMLLQGGRHVADIALLFPIAGYLGSVYFGNINTTSDYAQVADQLTNVSRRDFTFMHPEVLDSNCTVDPVNHTINLNNRVNYERYRVFIIPSGGTSGAINVSTMRTAKQFYDNGGVVIATSSLPFRSAELGQDTAIVNIATAMFGLDPKNPGVTYTKNTNANGGKAYWIQNINESISGIDRLTWVLDDALPVWDVKIDESLTTPGPFSYIHKVLDGGDYYFFANSGTSAIATTVKLKGKLTPRIMDPHTGSITDAQFQNTIEAGQDVTVVTLKVNAVQSTFIAGTCKIDATPPPQVANAVATLVSDQAIRLAWNAASDAESGICGYAIYRNGAILDTIAGGATDYTDSGLAESTNYSYQIEAINCACPRLVSMKSQAASRTTSADTRPPQVLSIGVTGDKQHVIIAFNEPVEKSSAEAIVNYAIAAAAGGAISISGAAMSADGRSVALATSLMQQGARYTLTLNGIKDRANAPNTIAANTSIPFVCIIYAAGLRYTYYEASLSSLAGITGLTTAQDSGIAAFFDISMRKRDANIAFRFTGVIEVPTTGQYTFSVNADDEASLKIDGAEVVHAQWSQGEVNGATSLSAGKHSISLDWYQGGGGIGLQVSWQGPGFAKEPIPGYVLFHAEGGPDLPMAAFPGHPALPAAFSLSAQGAGAHVQIRFGVPAKAAGSGVIIQICDLRGRTVRTLTSGNPVAAGYHAISLDASGLSNGRYLCRMRANGLEKIAGMSVMR
jgi:hypothetical protein